MSTYLNMKLTKHFQLWEFVKSPAADRLGIDNTPNAQEIKNLLTLCRQILEPARLALGPLNISSGFRSAALNKAIGGVANSAHRLGYAADVIPVSTSTRAFARWVSSNCNFDQVILEFGTEDNPNWVHVSCDPQKRMQLLRTADGRIYNPVKLA